LALLTAAGAIGLSVPADATAFWPDYDQPFYRMRPVISHRAHRVHRPRVRDEAPASPAAKPQSPLIIAISIHNQTMKIYDANGLFAETPISTGMRGHSTPMGAFSVIQKQKLHHSNIYSGAPMPYMQRITWSGIAIHAGVLPGYPASHGCIRMPMAFAIKMYGWTRMGARVVVTPDETTPASFSHPLLVMKAPQPAMAQASKAEVLSDRSGDAADASKPTILQARLELRSTVGHPAIFRPMSIYAMPASAPPGEPIRTADASGFASVGPAVRTTNDATPRAADNRVAAAKSTQTADAEEKPAGPANGSVGPGAPPQAKDPGRPADSDHATATKSEPNLLPEPNHTRPLSVFVSRKDAKLYVRQNFAPLFDVPIEIAASDRPLGTHVFTVETDKDDPTQLRWSVVSLPAGERPPAHRDTERSSPPRKTMDATGTLPAPLPDNPAEALDRLNIPAEAMTRIAEGLSTGSSIIVSDQGIAAGETGDGTDFIVSLR
jgi:hypothetical protein